MNSNDDFTHEGDKAVLRVGSLAQTPDPDTGKDIDIVAAESATDIRITATATELVFFAGDPEQNYPDREVRIEWETLLEFVPLRDLVYEMRSRGQGSE